MAVRVFHIDISIYFVGFLQMIRDVRRVKSLTITVSREKLFLAILQ